jgi:hypothetical protein
VPRPLRKEFGRAGKARTWDFAFATGIECSNPRIIDQRRSIRRDLLEEYGHYRHWRRDLELVKEPATPVLRYGFAEPPHPFGTGSL